ncbi:hypothetical protein J437_LFUL003030 [Ladona fulva]|uniref:Uncharacterized protein n=1 Tax=Ladona fulva TaxID=123851 RepID=A0A8K0NVL0_LADFU|nr:hypothetical protein J437_LFUL003030 [Ladona fulva]
MKARMRRIRLNLPYLCEELVHKDISRSVDLYEAEKATLARFSSTIDNMSGIVTVSAPTMVRHIPREFVYNGCNYGKCFERRHQNNTFCKIIYRQFQDLLITFKTSYEDMFCFTAVRWLSRVKILKCFYDLRNEIKCLMDSEGKPVPEFENENWLTWHF